PDRLGEGLGFALGWIVSGGEHQFVRYLLCRLLQRVGQLMGKELQPPPRPRLILARVEDDVLTDRIGQGAHGVCRSRGLGIGVDANGAKIALKARLQESAGLWLQRLTWRPHYLMDQRRSHTAGRGPAGNTLEAAESFPATCAALASAGAVFAAAALAL